MGENPGPNDSDQQENRQLDIREDGALLITVVVIVLLLEVIWQIEMDSVNRALQIALAAYALHEVMTSEAPK